MFLRCLKAELVKFHRSPVWLAFVLLPVFPAILGTVNYLGNIEVLENAWYSLWSQHTLFSSMFFLPALLSVFCAWQWRLEHTDHNWNSFLTAPVPMIDLCLAKLIWAALVSLLAQVWIGVLFVLSGKLAGISVPLPPELPEWLLCGAVGGVCGAALFQPEDPGLRPTGSLRTGGRHRRTNGHRPGLWICLPVLPAVYRDAG